MHGKASVSVGWLSRSSAVVTSLGNGPMMMVSRLVCTSAHWLFVTGCVTDPCVSCDNFGIALEYLLLPLSQFGIDVNVLSDIGLVPGSFRDPVSARSGSHKTWFKTSREQKNLLIEFFLTERNRIRWWRMRRSWCYYCVGCCWRQFSGIFRSIHGELTGLKKLFSRR